MTKVGYGDYYPNTAMARLWALVLMTVGVGIFGVLSSFLASRFIGDGEEGEQPEGARINALHDDLSSVKQDVAAIKSQLDTVSELLQKLDS